MPKSKSGIKYQYRCDSCEYVGGEYDRKPIAEKGKQVRCPNCHKPHLMRQAI